ncbi:sigma-70 family RNA polymerase sigma factor [Sphingomonas aurantiaca]|uniref:sigma-70 family RNA polymerase sigma factor n=1 Tax=Sphingomonas aurantiaca TaxID=185949 RepID=UPI002FDF86C6
MNIVEPLTTLTVFSANRARLIGYLRSPGATNDAEDLAHEVWLRLDRLESTERVTTGYIMRIAHNLVIDQARAARQRRLREEAYHTDGSGVDDIDQAPNAERMLLSRERLNRLQMALARLGPRTEEIFRRHRLQGVPQRLLADEFGSLAWCDRETAAESLWAGRIYPVRAGGNAVTDAIDLGERHHLEEAVAWAARVHETDFTAWDEHAQWLRSHPENARLYGRAVLALDDVAVQARRTATFW